MTHDIPESAYSPCPETSVIHVDDGFEERVCLDLKQCGINGMLEHMSRYLFATRFVQSNRVLDVACGTGYGTMMLANASAALAVGADLDPAAQHWAASHFQTPGLQYRLIDACAIDSLNQKFDLIVSFETIEHLREPDRFVHAVRRSLAPGGTFLISTPFRRRETSKADGSPLNPHHLFEWDFLEFRAFLSKHFQAIDWYTQGIWPKKDRYPFSRSFRKRKIRRWYRENAAESPRFAFDPAVRRFPEPLGNLVEALYLIAVCRA